jgi:hypothetical protein
MSSRSLAAARARRAGENAPPVSGNRPITSIGSQAAFAQQMPSNINYNTPPPPNNVRIAKSAPRQQQQQPQQQYDQYGQQPQSKNGVQAQKISIANAIGLITLRLGRVEQWIVESENCEESFDENGAPTNHTVIDNSVLTTIINRLDSLEKNGLQTEDPAKMAENVKLLTEQFKRMSDDVAKHTIEIAKNTEQVFRFNRELTETKDILKSFMVKYDMFAQETTQNFSDYELALSDLEKRLPVENDYAIDNSSIRDIDTDDTIDATSSLDLKNLIKKELSNSDI